MFGSSVEQQSASQLSATLHLFESALCDPSNFTSDRFRRVAATALAAAAQFGVHTEVGLAARITEALVRQVLCLFCSLF